MTDQRGSVRRLAVKALVSFVATAVVMSAVGSGVAVAEFEDVEGVHAPAVAALDGLGVFEGTACGEGLFCPGEPVRRWTMAVWLVRVLEESEPQAGSSRFVDVDVAAWWMPYVERLADLGITHGCATEPARFCPEDPVTRAQMASFLARAFGLEAPEGSPEVVFSDVGEGVHTDSIYALAASGITVGCASEPEARFCPGRPTTRAQMASFLNRARIVSAVGSGVAVAEFEDVEGVHAPAVAALEGLGVFEGTACGEGLFCPGEPVRRWTMAVWLVRVLDESEPQAGSSRFDDVDDSEWWMPHVERLADLGITHGCATEPARFCPEDPVTRAQMASFLSRAFGLEAPEGPPEVEFSDVGEGVHTDSIYALAASGITVGCASEPEARFCPGRFTTRAQMASFLERAYSAYIGPGPTEAEPEPSGGGGSGGGGVGRGAVTTTTVTPTAVTVRFGAASHTATEGGTAATVQVILSAAPERTVTVPLVVTEADRATADDYMLSAAQVTFEAGNTSATFSVTAVDDSHYDGDESITIGFGELSAGVIAASPRAARVSLVDNDDPPEITVSFGAVSYDAWEGGATATVQVALSGASQHDVSVPLVVTEADRATADDYMLSAAQVTFEAGNTSATFSVTAVDDSHYDGDESITIGFGELSAGVIAASPRAARVSLVDNDDPPEITVSFGAVSYDAWEGGATATVMVVLSADPGRTISVPVKVTDRTDAAESDYRLSTTSVTFEAGDTSAALTVTAVDDSDDDDGESITLGFGTLPPGVTAASPNTARVALADNDDPLGRVTMTLPAGCVLRDLVAGNEMPFVTYIDGCPSLYNSGHNAYYYRLVVREQGTVTLGVVGTGASHLLIRSASGRVIERYVEPGEIEYYRLSLTRTLDAGTYVIEVAAQWHHFQNRGRGQTLSYSGSTIARPQAYKLIGLSITNVNLASFAPGTTKYSRNVAADVQTVTVTPTATLEDADVTIMPPDADTSTDGHQVNIAAIGTTEITIAVNIPMVVNAGIVYRVALNQVAGTTAPLSDIASLASLSFEGIVIGDFNSDKTAYTYPLAFYERLNGTTATMSVTAAAGATWTTNRTDENGDVAGHKLSINGSGAILVTVASQDNANTRVYRVAAESPMTRDSSKDICRSCDVHRPYGMWSDGTTMMTLNRAANTLHVFDIETNQQTSTVKFTPPSYGNWYADESTGFWTDSETVWIMHQENEDWEPHDNNLLYAYSLETQDRVTTKDILFPDERGIPIALWIDGERMYMATTRDGLYIYEFPSAVRIASIDYNAGRPRSLPYGNTQAMWSDGTTLYMAIRDGWIRAYDAESGRRVPGLDFRPGTSPLPTGIWSDGRTMWVIDRFRGYPEAYSMLENARLWKLSVSDGDIGYFHNGKFDYDVEVPAGTTSTTITAEAAFDGGTSSIVFGGTDSDDQTDGHQTTLTPGTDTEITITVTAPNGTDTEVYTVTITHAITTTTVTTTTVTPVAVRFGAASHTATEGGAAATVQVVLSADPERTVDVPLTVTRSGGATPGDYTVSATGVTFHAGQTTASFTVTAIDDSDDDDESVTIRFGTLPPGVTAASPSTAQVALADNDDPLGRVTMTLPAGCVLRDLVAGNEMPYSSYYNGCDSLYTQRHAHYYRLVLRQAGTVALHAQASTASHLLIRSAGGKILAHDGESDNPQYYSPSLTHTLAAGTYVIEVAAHWSHYGDHDRGHTLRYSGPTIARPARYKLAELAITDVNLEHFTPGTTEYRRNVAGDVGSVTVTPTATLDDAEVTVMPPDADPSTDGYQVDIDADVVTEITVTVNSPMIVDVETEYRVELRQLPGTTAPLSDDTGLSSLSFDKLDIGDFSSDKTDYKYSLGYYERLRGTTATMTLTAVDGATWTANRSDENGDVAGHQLSIDGTDTILVTVTSQDKANTREYRVAPEAPMTRDASRDICSSCDVSEPYGLWSDGESMMTISRTTNTLHVFDMETKKQQSTFALARPSYQGSYTSASRGLWSNGEILWVLYREIDSWKPHENNLLYAYSLETRARLPDEDILFPDEWGSPVALWIDGERMYLPTFWDILYIYTFPGASDVASVEYDSGFDERPSESTRAIWSDGTTLWMALRDAWVRAYDADSGRRIPGLDFRTGPQEPRGLWSDGRTMWVIDVSRGYPQAYSMLENARLWKLSVSDGDIGNFHNGKFDYDVEVPAGTASTTITAEAAFDGGSSSIVFSGSDADGHQVALTPGEDAVVTITVTAPNGTDTEVYTVTITHAS